MYAVKEEKTSLVCLRWNFFDTKPVKEELIGQYMERLEELASDCDFNNFTVKDALLYNLLNYKILPDHRKEILKSHLDYEQVLRFAQSLENANSENLDYNGFTDEIDQSPIDQLCNFKEELTEDNFDGLEEPLKPFDLQEELNDNDIHEKMPMVSKNNSTKRYSCVLCHSVFKYKKSLNTHLEIKHSFKEGLSNAYNCENCNSVFNNNKSLKKHLHKRHSKESENQCIDCGKSFSSLSKLNAHKKKQHNIETELLPPLGSTYIKKCPFCQQTFQIEMGELSSSKMKQHLERVHVKEDFSELTDIFEDYKKGCLACEHCGQCYSCKSVLEHHKDVAHPETVESISCHICGVSVKNKRSMSQHLSLHSKTRTFYPCSHCGKQFTSVGNLKIHENIHMASESPCDLCGKKFKSPYHVTKHKKMFHEKNYASRGVCDQCEKTFVTPYRLKLHIQAVHKQEKPFPCEVCGFRCARFDNLNLHRRKTHLINQNLTRIALEKMISEGFHKFCSSAEERPQYRDMNNTNSRINPT